jgi:type IV secretion system protein VirB6
MPCVALSSGSGFLSATLAQVDCQAGRIGSYGYGALADPGSPISAALGGVLTIFIAIFGVRLALGDPFKTRDTVGMVVRIGIVLTLATSWPAWRVVGYDLIMDGPAEIARTVALGAGLPGSSNDLRDRLQRVDDGLVTMTANGTGRLPGSDLRDAFRGIAVEDEAGFGWGRLLFLAGTIAPYAIVRLGAGILLALAPLFGIFLLFGGSSSLFHGWIRGLAFTALGSLGISLVQGVNLAILEPWITDAIMRRTVGEFTPATATEMAALSLVYVIVMIGALLLIARVTFFSNIGVQLATLQSAPQETLFRSLSSPVAESSRTRGDQPARAHDIAASVARSVRREERESWTNGAGAAVGAMASGSPRAAHMPTHSRPGKEMLGGSYRRTFSRSAASREQRDRKA